MGPFRANGSKQPIRIAPAEEKRLAELRDWMREWDGRKRQEGEGPNAPCYTGEPNYSGRKKKKKEKDGPNEYMRTIMYDGGAPGIMLYRCGGRDEAGAANISRLALLNIKQALDAVANRSVNDETVRLLLSSLAESKQVTYLKKWKIWVNYCRSRQIAHWMDTSTQNWDREVLGFLTWGHTVMNNGWGDWP